MTFLRHLAVQVSCLEDLCHDCPTLFLLEFDNIAKSFDGERQIKLL